MNYDVKISRAAVLGAAGKMGSGILLLTAAEMTDVSLKPENKEKVFSLFAIDLSEEALQGLRKYLKTQLLKMAEKKTVGLRQLYQDRPELIENEDIIRQYVDDAMGIIHFTTRIESAYNAQIVFEAAVEDVNLKVDLIRKIKDNSDATPWFLTNTSSIPISELNKKAELDGNIVGFHFYNPPAVQRILEFVAPDGCNPDLLDFSLKLAKNMKKVVVQPGDFAGFIGNGFLMRDILFGIAQAEKLTTELGFPEAVYVINRISNDFLVRPMGVFQLMDYVGIDVCQKIMLVMADRLNKPELHSNLIDKLIDVGVKGGQYADGSQKPGSLKYEKGKPTEVFDPEKNEYVSIDGFRDKCDAFVGKLPESHQPWKAVIRMPGKDSLLDAYFGDLKKMNTKGAQLAIEYLKNAKDIGQQLVDSGIAKNAEDVNTVMKTGFYHAYGIINDYV